MAMMDIMEAAYQWVTSTVNESYTSTDHDYVAPEDNEEDDEDEYEWVTRVIIGTPLKETKCFFVPELLNYYTREQLNTIYHSAYEYENAVKKYGLIYKSQKFANADTAQKLLDYSKDWIKNNYHGGIVSFNISALDMRLAGQDVQKYLTGQRVRVQYMDPDIHQETEQTLTVISAEYDLNNPENNNYKIGIPDVSLNKVYGETAKKGGGGGGGGKSSSETDNETDTEVEQLTDNAEADTSQKMEMIWAMLYKGTKDGNLDTRLGDLLTPNSKDQISDWIYGLTPDFLKTSNVQSTSATINTVKSQYVESTGGVDAQTVSSNKGNITTVNSKDVNVSNDANITNKTKTKDLEATNDATITNKTTTKDLEVTNNASVSKKISSATLEVSGAASTNSLSVTNGISAKTITTTGTISSGGTVTGQTGSFQVLRKGGLNVATVNDMPSVLPKIKISIDGVTYTVHGKRG